MIPLPPHRAKGPGVLGATPEQPIGPFCRWSEPGEAEDQDEPDKEHPAGNRR
ncbi:hypothetical protein AB0D11_37050 [Streptomyces monashensis]|uniref:hypothetical protein n=1 Tax=Streptomyces monashensis TaxID=1678012 RepID=UPI0033EAE181